MHSNKLMQAQALAGFASFLWRVAGGFFAASAEVAP
jgi:hypothetical protein